MIHRQSVIALIHERKPMKGQSEQVVERNRTFIMIVEDRIIIRMFQRTTIKTIFLTGQICMIITTSR